MKTNTLMKKLCLLSAILFLATALPAQIFLEDFGTVGGGPYSTANTTLTGQCGGDGVDPTDYFGVVLAADISETYTGGSGAFLAAMDMDGAPCSAPATGSADITGIPITGETGIVVCFDVAEADDGANQDWDNTDVVTLSADIDGTGAQTLFAIHYDMADGNTFNNEPAFDCDADGIGDGTPMSATFTTYCVPVNGTGATLSINISIALNSGDEDIAIDNVAVYSDSSPAPTTNTGCNVATVLGCTDMNACNFDATANSDDGSCFSIGDACDDSDGSTINDVWTDCTTCAGTSTGLTECVPAPAIATFAEVDNSDFDQWTSITNGYSMNGFCGGGCAEAIDQWLIFGPIDFTAVTMAQLNFAAAENFGTTDLDVLWSNNYTGGAPSAATWTSVLTISAAGPQSAILNGATGSAVYIGIQYLDDGADGYSNWDLTDFIFLADNCSTPDCPVLGLNIGDTCDDMDATTINDVVQADCTCSGVPAAACTPNEGTFPWNGQ